MNVISHMKLKNKVDFKYSRSFDFNYRKNTAYVNILGLVLCTSVFINFINISLSVIFHLGSTTIITFVIYGLLMTNISYQVIKFRGITAGRLIIYFLCLSIFLLNFLIFEYSRSYLLDGNMLLIYFCYIPISIFVISAISKWDLLMKIAPKYACFGVISSTLGITVIGFENHIGYMPFSYSLLPLVIILYCAARKNLKSLNSIFFLIGFIDMIVFGARAPILFILVYIILNEIILLQEKNLKKKLIFITFYLITGIIILLFSNYIINSLIIISDSSNSRFLNKLFTGKLTESTGRDIIYAKAKLAIEDMSGSIYGLFGDRYILSELYVHNIFYEFLLSFGILFGVVGIMILFALIVSAIFIKDTTLKTIAVLFTTAFFLRYLVSGSFIIEGNFYLYIAILLNVCFQKRSLV